jgi:structural maintenance of chromosome 2
VSLKEGMFNNANVLFKARFRDGTSVVERFTQRPSTNDSATTTKVAKARAPIAGGLVGDKENALTTNRRR